jgi:hypothetical protein
VNEAQAEQDDDKILFLQQLVEDRATVAADVVEVDAHTWVVHGVIPVGGDVIMAEFETQDQAKKALRRLSAPEHSPLPDANLNDRYEEYLTRPLPPGATTQIDG